MDQEQKPRERSIIRELVPDWQPTREQVLWAVRIAIVLVAVLGILTLIGLPFDITLWEWAKLLIVPAALAGGVAWLNWAQRQRERQAEEARRERELEVENQRAQDTALQAYLDKMDDMLTRLRYEIGSASTEELSGSGATDSGDRKAPVRIRDLRTLIRARTLTVLERLDGVRKRAVMRFLLELRLIDGEGGYRVRLHDVNFERADLSRMNLSDTNLRGVRLTHADLSGADLREADLREADLTRADLKGARLGTARTVDASTSRSLRPRQAKLAHADLSTADLESATGISDGQLEAAKSLVGATMPNGQKYEDWLKDKEGRGEDG